jgi:hypothetical protein
LLDQKCTSLEHTSFARSTLKAEAERKMLPLIALEIKRKAPKEIGHSSDRLPPSLALATKENKNKYSEEISD